MNEKLALFGEIHINISEFFFFKFDKFIKFVAMY